MVDAFDPKPFLMGTVALRLSVLLMDGVGRGMGTTWTSFALLSSRPFRVVHMVTISSTPGAVPLWRVQVILELQAMSIANA